MDNIDEKLVQTLKEQMTSIPTVITSIEELKAAAEPLAEILCTYFNYTGDREEIIQRVMFYLNDFIGKAITEEDFIKNIFTDTQTIIGNTEVTPTDEGSSGNHGGGGFGSGKKTKKTSTITDKAIVDVDVEMISKISEHYSKIEDLVNNTKLEFDAAILDAAPNSCSALNEYIKKSKKELTKLLEEISKQVKETLKKIQEVDESIKPIDLSKFNFNDIWKTTTKWVKSKPLKRADADFFKANGCTVKDGVATFKKGNKTYAYNIRSGSLIVTDSNGKEMKSDNMSFSFYIPTSGDYSKCNTLTTLVSSKTTFSKSTGIVIQAGIKDSSKAISHNLVAESTRFMNGVAKTDLTKCQNAIIGGSQWGARSLDIASKTGDLYKTVYCVNNALIVNGENGVPGGKYKVDAKNLKNLNGKNIYFISANGEPNAYKKAINGDAWPDSGCRLNQSYLYTGIELLLKNCPDAQVYLLSNINETQTLSKLSNKYSNYHYDKNAWNKVMKKNYSGHAYAGIIQDVVDSALVGYNGYSSGTKA